MSNQFDEYLQKVERYLRALPPAAREGELREIEGHLHQLSADFESEGHTSDEAAALALQRFGTARCVGTRLRDVWEQNHGALAVGLTVVVANYLTFLLSARFIGGFFFGLFFDKQFLMEALSPVFLTWLFGMVSVQPFLCNFLCGWWAGRRAVPAAVAVHLPLFLLCLIPLSVSWKFAGAEFGLAVNLVFMTISAALGAYFGTLWRRKARFVAVSGPQISYEKASIMLRQRLSPGVQLWPFVIVLALVTVIIGTGFWVAKSRMHELLHPATPEKAVRVLLSDLGANFGDMTPSTEVVTRLLPPQLPAEKAGLQRRVAFSARMHATPAYRKRRREYLEKQILIVQEGRLPKHRLPYLRTSLKRLGPEGYRMKGVLRVSKTPDGWKVDTSGGRENQPWAWLYDIYYEEPK